MNTGELRVHVVPNAALMTLTREQVELLQSFNALMFQKLLKLIQAFAMVDKEDNVNSYFVVPTQKGKCL